MERTYTMIKPECVAGRHIGDVIARIEKGGYKILGIKMLHMSKQDAGKFYEIHKARPFYGELTEFMSSGPIVAMPFPISPLKRPRGRRCARLISGGASWCCSSIPRTIRPAARLRIWIFPRSPLNSKNAAPP